MTFSPSVNDDGTYNTDAGYVSYGCSGGQYDTPYHEDEVTGERQYLIQTEDLQQDGDFQPSVDEEYQQAIREVYPDINNALEYALHNKTEEWILDFNSKIDGGNFDEYVPLIEELMEEYRLTVSAPVDEMETDAADVTQEEIDAVIEPMLEAEPEGLESAYNWLQAAEEYQDTNPVYSAVCSATAAFHNNQMTAEEAISSVLENHPLEEVIEIYQYLSNQNWLNTELLCLN